MAKLSTDQQCVVCLLCSSGMECLPHEGHWLPSTDPLALSHHCLCWCAGAFMQGSHQPLTKHRCLSAISLSYKSDAWQSNAVDTTKRLEGEDLEIPNVLFENLLGLDVTQKKSPKRHQQEKFSELSQLIIYLEILKNKQCR